MDARSARGALCTQSWRDQPASREPRRNLRPRIATPNQWAWVEALVRNRSFILEYADARARWRDGIAAVFPPGTYWLYRFAAVARRARAGQHREVFVIELIYKADLSEIDAVMKAHVAWLDRHYAAGTFLVSGRKVPRDGGIIIASGSDRAAIEAIVREDPFVGRGLADVRIIQFRASQRADDLPARVRDR